MRVPSRYDATETPLTLAAVASSLTRVQSIPGTILAVSEGVVAMRRHGNANQDGEANARGSVDTRS